MNNLFFEISSWSGYIDRPAVTWQLLLITCALITDGFIRKQLSTKNASLSTCLAVGPLTLIVISILLGVASIPTGITIRFGSIWAAWNLLLWIEQKLIQRNPKDRRARWLRRLARPAILVFALLYCIDRLSSLSSIGLINVGTLLDSQLALGKLFSSLIGLYLILIASAPIAFLISLLSQAALKISDQSRHAIEIIVRYLLISFGLLAVALQAGFNATALLTISAGLSVGLGFGVKEIFANIFSGIWLLFEGSIRPGEILMIKGEPCRVNKLLLRATLLSRERDDAELLIPNQTLFNQDAESFTAGENFRRDEVVVGAAYHHEPQQVMALLEQVACQHPRVLLHPAPKAFAIDFAESSINYKLKYSVRHPLEALTVSSNLRQEIWTAFNDHGIGIPFPQRQVYPMEWPPNSQSSLQSQRNPHDHS
ncbi:mechanosensitive ion channel domain-containing protein [Synechococcus sp. MU1655]|uniref:mechanosensitive ion channel family protein n=1 Tax=Synechococcus sp. MU1655 TaxID=2508355 RepID=UPI002027414F|nr:mechanosensitive ion channel domain-containing protein [Synechococcus sp. MU1655]